MIGAEIPFLMGFLYPFLNYVWWFPKKRPALDASILHEPEPLKGVQLYRFVTVQDPPIFVNLNNIIVPLHGGTHRETRFVASAYRTPAGFIYTNYRQIERAGDHPRSFQSAEYLNTADDVVAMFEAYNLKRKDVFVTLPLKADYYTYTRGAYLHQRTGCMAARRELLLKELLHRHRLPLTYTVPGVAATMLAFCWIHGWMQVYPMNHRLGYAPPFHPQRIRGYFAQRFK